jgi:hypothetical protein
MGGHCYDVSRSKDEQFLYYSNAEGVVIYSRTQKNFNN